MTLWSRDGRLLDRQQRANAVCSEGGIARLDAAGIAAWLRTALAKYAGEGVQYCVPVGHGAGLAVLLDSGLAFAPLDYEAAPPAELAATYAGLRAPFAETGSPALPLGLNLGTQLAWLDALYPDVMPRATLVPWAQYWAWWLTGCAASEVTTLGCHSDLWAPAAADWSSLARAQGWAGRFAPLARAGDVIGTLRPDLAAATGLAEDIRVLAGLHDSNAALMAARGFADIAQHEATVLSTGTWFVAMRLAARPVAIAGLPQARDCLVNVDAFGAAVPSARFMGGREIEMLIEGDAQRVDIVADQPQLLAAVPQALADQAMVLPTWAPGCGPFPTGHGRWVQAPPDGHARRAAVCLYAALVADAALDLIGAEGRLLIEGRFAGAHVFVRALARLRPHSRVYLASDQTDVSFGALRLIDPALAPPGSLEPVMPLDNDLEHYRSCWRAMIDGCGAHKGEQ